MRESIAFCGLICSECPAFLATKENDLDKKEKLANLWADLGESLTQEDITCYGCKTIDQKKTKFCQICSVRDCCMQKGIANCAHCPDYPCSKYLNLIEKIESPEAKENLDQLNDKTEF